jgi:excisionase family DNA binding protein
VKRLEAEMSLIDNQIPGCVDARRIHPLALRPKDAAKALSIGERLLWSKTNAGEIPHVRIGRTIVYPIEQLREWLAAQAKRSE